MEQTGRCGTSSCVKYTKVHTQIHLMYKDSHYIPLSRNTVTHHQPCTSQKLSQACHYNERAIHDIGSWFFVAGSRFHLAALHLPERYLHKSTKPSPYYFWKWHLQTKILVIYSPPPLSRALRWIIILKTGYTEISIHDTFTGIWIFTGTNSWPLI
jgi:hypothetical protein